MNDSTIPAAEFGRAFRRFMDTVLAEAAAESALLDRITDHLGGDPTRLPVIVEEFDAFEHPNVQVALDDYLSRPGREAELTGVAVENKRFGSIGLSDLLSRPAGRGPLAEGPVDYVNFHLDGDRVLSCVQFGLYFVRDADARLLVFVTGPSDRFGPRMRVRVEVMGERREDAQTVLVELADSARRLNVYRGRVISLSPNQMGMGPQTLVQFHRLPAVDRDDVVLPASLLDRVERQTIVFSRHAERLLAAGRSLKRGLLLYGLPGTGKTLTVSYLAGRMADRTVILTTGRGMGLMQQVAQMARVLAPSMVVLEDVDLVAEHRGQPFQPTGPLLFELLNEMDGLREDCDVIFVLTTNRPDMLEPALAARPGRIDLAVELPLPDTAGRRRLLELYGRGLDLGRVDLDAVVQRTEGVTPAYVKELLRRTALLVAEEGSAAVEQRHLHAAMAELAEGGRLAEPLLGYRPQEGGAAPPLPAFPQPGAAWRVSGGGPPLPPPAGPARP